MAGVPGGAGLVLGLALALPAGAGADGGDPPPDPGVVVMDAEIELPESDARIDADRSRVGFAVRMRWFSRVEGRFDRFSGIVAALDQGWRRVEVEVDATSVDVGGRQRMTEWAQSDEFFDVARHPAIVFVSDPFAPQLAIDGGRLQGDLSLRGTTARVSFDMLPAACAFPGRECPIVVEGRVSRAKFGMDAHRVAVQDRVELRFEVLLAEPGEAPWRG